MSQTTADPGTPENAQKSKLKKKEAMKSVGLSEVLTEEIKAVKARRAALWPPSPELSPQTDSGTDPAQDQPSPPAASAAGPPRPPSGGSGPGKDEDEEKKKVAERSRELNRLEVLGLAISGGGIRSATFSLGVIQALAEERLLRHVDYLSTVSGGGYIGSWLSKLIYTATLPPKDVPPALSQKSDGPPLRSLPEPTHLERFSELEIALQPPVSEHAAVLSGCKTPQEHPAIGWLRQFSNYLAPRVGMFSADVWSIATIWVRNAILNQVILAAILGCLMLVPYLFRYFPQFVKPCFGAFWPWVSFGLATAFFVAALAILTWGVWAVARKGSSAIRQKWVVIACFLLYFAAYFSAVSLPELNGDPKGQLATFRWLTFFVVAAGSTAAAWAGMRERLSPWTGILSAAFVSLLVTGVFSGGLYVIRPLLSESDSAPFLVLGTSAILLLFGLQVVLVLGILGRAVDDLVREWWARVGAWLSIISVAMGVLALAAFYAHEVFRWIQDQNITVPTALAWIAMNVLGITAGASPATSGEQKKPSLGTKAKEIAVGLAPAVFAIGAILLVANGIHLLMTTAKEQQWISRALESLSEHLHSLLASAAGVDWPPAWSGQDPHAFVYASAALGILLLVAFSLSWRVDVNEFSMHNFYRNRLVRCYLGASGNTPDRERDRITNFSREDDVPLKTFRYDHAGGVQPYIGPVPIINAAINLATPDTGKQERRADSFIFTPYHCGFDSEEPGEKNTAAQGTSQGAKENDSQAGEDERPKKHYLPTPEYCDPLFLGHAFTVSGAAASPNMGYHTSGAIALLMTIFNVRLGWWFPNPSKTYKDKWRPRFGIFPLIKELFASADKNYSFVYVSDGGHFENLAVYELLRRRCRYIICCDAEEDGDFSFGGLGGLVRKARADFGIEIQIDPRAIARRNARGDSEVHCAVGNIWYPESDLTGTLLYLKSSVTGDEPTDILQYRAAEKKFPHQTTGDQFFSESQFESYRRLGYHVARRVFEPIRDSRGKLPYQNGDDRKRPDESLRKTFIALRQAWGAAPRYDVKDFTALVSRLDMLMERLRQDRTLAFLIPEFYLQWKQICDDTLKCPPKHGENEGSDTCDPKDDADSQCEISDKGQAPKLVEVICDENTRQSVFVFCHSLIQLMEDAYSLLDLECHYKHPDTHGWMNLFRHWSWNPEFRLVYSLTACTFGSRFQSFCERHLDLQVGEIEVREILEIDKILPTDLKETLDADQKQKLQKAGFNHVERPMLARLLRKLLTEANAQQPSKDSPPTHKGFQVYAIKAVPNLAIPEERKHDEKSLPPDLTIGFAVAETGPSGGDTLRWIRIQDHLRRMGFGRKALLELWRKGTVKRFKEAPRPEELKAGPVPEGTLDWYEAESERNIHWVKSVVPWEPPAPEQPAPAAGGEKQKP